MRSRRSARSPTRSSRPRAGPRSTGGSASPIAGSTHTQTQLALNFSYDLDLWGRNRALYDAAVGQVRAAEVDLFAARLLVSTSVAHAYLQLGRAFDQLELAQKTLEQRSAIQ